MVNASVLQWQTTPKTKKKKGGGVGVLRCESNKTKQQEKSVVCASVGGKGTSMMNHTPLAGHAEEEEEDERRR